MEINILIITNIFNAKYIFCHNLIEVIGNIRKKFGHPIWHFIYKSFVKSCVTLQTLYETPPGSMVIMVDRLLVLLRC